ncbi:molybdenum transporter [Halobacteriales archaeon SW_5_68_122]|nr:MAG: molybdenum transporter [Halobacteriales archaeon SW_5_68_122]
MQIQRRELLGALGAGATACAAGCAGVGGRREADRPGVAGETLTLTTTTSTYDTGLLDAIHPEFEAMYGVSVDAVAQGTGAALETARNGDSDAVMVHARGLEDEFLREGHGVNRRDLMFNDFVFVGPESDPAGIEGWYQETGAGMGEALNVANQQGAYTLSDRGTFIAQRSQLDLVVLVQGPIKGGPEILANPYGIMAVNPGVHEGVNYDLAMAYIGWITSPDAQDAIAAYESDGEQLFFPEAVSEAPDFQQYVPEGWSDESTGG